MSLFELRSWCVFWKLEVFGVCLVLSACLLLPFGCARGPDPVAVEIDIDEDTKAAITLKTLATFSKPEYHTSLLPKNGAISGTPPNMQYTLSPNFFGNDEFEYGIVRANSRLSRTATVKISVSAVNDPPVTKPTRVVTAANTAVTIKPQAVDVDGPIVGYEIVTLPKYDTAERKTDEFRYTPKTGFLGCDSFEYVANDEPGHRSVDTEVIVRETLRPVEEIEMPERTGSTVPVLQVPTTDDTDPPQIFLPENYVTTNSPQNTPPEVKDLKVLDLEDEEVLVILDARDADGSVVRYGITTLPTHGTLRGAL